MEVQGIHVNEAEAPHLVALSVWPSLRPPALYRMQKQESPKVIQVRVQKVRVSLSYDSRVDPTPDVLLFFFSYFLIQGCLRTSGRASRSSGLYRRSCIQFAYSVDSALIG